MVIWGEVASSAYRGWAYISYSALDWSLQQQKYLMISPLISSSLIQNWAHGICQFSQCPSSAVIFAHFYKLNTIIIYCSLLVCCMIRVWMLVASHACGDQRATWCNQFSPVPFAWIPGIELRPPDLLDKCLWVLNQLTGPYYVIFNCKVIRTFKA